jgi:guanosine-3',5'-bis(diphosphate) 3'-pyrophosphohydrolase
MKVKQQSSIKKGPSMTASEKRLQNLMIKVGQSNALEMDQARIQRAYELLENSVPKPDKNQSDNTIQNALETAEILTEIHADEDTIVAALLYNLVLKEYSSVEVVREQFGTEVATLIQRTTRTRQIKFKSRFEEQAESFRKMILAMAKDIRVVLLNLAGRLQLMRTIARADAGDRQEIALESLEIYAPLANRLGIARIKWEMEDLCLKALHPSIYRELEERVPQDRKERKAYIQKVTGIVEEAMKAEGITGEVVGRSKHFYSIYQKIVKRGVSFEEIFDLIALRIITETKTQCYFILGMIHSFWKPIPGRFKDYIGVPKTNMYQSLHTTVIGPEGQKVEFQIRTREMHRIAEHGIAAHWKYKEGVKTASSLDNKFAWFRQLLEWQQELKSPREFMESVKTDLFEETVYVFTPQGDVKELPNGSTPLDFAYSIHSDVGDRCVGAKVNKRMVPLRTFLKTGDTVEILTSKNQTPNKDWLKLVKSTKARNRIRHFLNQLEQDRSLSLGQEILEKSARKYGLSLSKILKSDKIHKVVGELGFSKQEKMIAALGFGKISAKQILNHFIPEEELPEPAAPATTKKTVKRKPKGIKIRGIGDILVHFSQCCNPVPGDEIIGFITRGKGVSIHRMDCSNVGGGVLDSERLVDVDWDMKEESVRPVRISAITTNRPGILANISAKISSENINISAADLRKRKDGYSVCTLELEIRNRKELDRILHAISQIKEVLEVKRVTGV